MIDKTPKEALLWLAGLETVCRGCINALFSPDNAKLAVAELRRNQASCVCGGTGKVPVLPNLREYHPDCLTLNERIEESTRFCDILFKQVYGDCKGIGWLPKQGRDTLHEVMTKNGWDYEITQRVKSGFLSEGRTRLVSFTKPDENWTQNRILHRGTDSDDHIAAYKAMQAAGYGGKDAP